MSYGRRVAGVCSRCDEIFTRRVVDCGRTKNLFCSKRCHNDSMRTGRRKVEVHCSGCGTSFTKLVADVRRSVRHFCTAPCYLATVDRVALGKAAAVVHRKIPRIARFLRSQKAGLARARALSAERLHEIAMKGVEARRAKKAARGSYKRLERPEINLGLEWFGPLLKREEA